MELPSIFQEIDVRPFVDPGPVGEAWAALLALTLAVWELVRDRAEPLGLTAPQAKALLIVRTARGLTMRELAARMRYDASSVTYICERLEQRGLLARRPHPADRRARVLHLTPEGKRLAQQLLTALAAPPLGLATMSAVDAEKFLELLRAVSDGLAAHPAPQPSGSA